MKRLVLSITELTTDLHCRQLAKWRHVDGWVPRREPVHLRLGTSLHAGLEQLYRAHLQPPGVVHVHGKPTRNDERQIAAFAAQLRAKDALKQALAAFNLDGDGFAIDRAQLRSSDLLKHEESEAILEGMLGAYPGHWRAADEEWEVVGVELPYRYRLSEHVDLRGKVDLVVRWKGRLWLVEHKTAGKADKDYLDRAHLDWQVKAYALAVLQVLGELPAGVIYNVLRKPEIKMRQSEDHRAFCERIVSDYGARPDFYFQREPVPVSVSNAEQFLDDAGYAAEDIWARMMLDAACATGMAKVGMRAPRPHWYQNTGSCTKWGRCPYMGACLSGRKIHEADFVQAPEGPQQRIWRLEDA